MVLDPSTSFRLRSGRGRYCPAAVDAIQAIVLGIVQGLTEFLPVSSTAHLRIVPAFMGWEDPGAAFTAVIQLGTMAAVLIYFRKDLWRIITTWFKSLYTPELRGNLDARMGWYIGLGTIPIAIFGLIFKDQIESGARNLYLIGTTLIVLGFVLLIAEKVGKRDRELSTINSRDAAWIGLAQALALVPGVSRSGSTISAGLVAFIVGYASIAWLLRYLVSHTTVVFVIYRVALGALVIALTAGGAIS